MQHPSNCIQNRFEFLFEDAKQRNQSKEKLKDIIMDQECTFHPRVNSANGYYSNSKIRTQKKENSCMMKDNNTFKPKVGRSPKNGHNSLCLPIGDYLYSQSRMKKRLFARLQENEVKESRAKSNYSHVKEKSRHLIEEKKEKIFKEIFNILDRDGDGIIRTNNINLKGNLL